MAVISRTLLILGGFVLASFVAVSILSGSRILADFDNYRIYSGQLGLAGYFLHLLLSTAGGIILAFIPTFLALIFTETMKVRSRTFYVATAGLGACLIDIACTQYPIVVGLRSFCVKFTFSELITVTVAGTAAGYVFWRVAGRCAGRWHVERPTNATAVT